MNISPIRMIAGALLFAAPCASAPSPDERSSALASVDDDGASPSRFRARSPVGAERNSEGDEIHRELDAARIRLSRTEARIRREEGRRGVDDVTRAAVEAKTRAALDMLSPVGGVAMRDEGDKTVMTVASRLLFASATADLLPQATGPLGSLAEALAEEGESRILIVDRSSARPSDDVASAGLSQKRSDAVRDFLVSHGVRSHLVTAKSGESGSLTGDATDRGKDRGVEIIVEPIEGR